MHANVGVGIALGALTTTAELEIVDLIGSPGGFSFNGASAAGLSARYTLDHVSPYLLVSSPLDAHYRSEYVTITAGVTAML